MFNRNRKDRKARPPVPNLPPGRTPAPNWEDEGYGGGDFEPESLEETRETPPQRETPPPFIDRRRRPRPDFPDFPF